MRSSGSWFCVNQPDGWHDVPDRAEICRANQTSLTWLREISDLELRLLDRSIAADGVQIFIGEESGYEILDECSVIAAPYRVDDETVGVLGVIGPTRMAYERVIPIVDITAKLMGAALNSNQ